MARREAPDSGTPASSSRWADHAITVAHQATAVADGLHNGLGLLSEDVGVHFVEVGEENLPFGPDAD